VTGVVSWVYDGDTVEVSRPDGVELDVRMLGLNAPENGECFHDAALENAITLLKGAEVGLTETSTDQFGRTLAHVWVGSRHIGLELVEAGYAIATTPDSADPYGSQLLQAERSAVQAGRGLWGSDICGASGPIPELTIEVAEHDPSGPDDNRLEGEVVEVVNRGDEEVDLTGWTIRDESSRHRFRVPDGTFLAGGARLSVSSAHVGWDPGDSPVWNNDGDLAMLLDRWGRVVDAKRY
jgi:hypothetical protein